MAADDILWRRTKTGLEQSAATRQALEHYISSALAMISHQPSQNIGTVDLTDWLRFFLPVLVAYWRLE